MYLVLAALHSLYWQDHGEPPPPPAAVSAGGLLEYPLVKPFTTQGYEFKLTLPIALIPIYDFHSKTSIVNQLYGRLAMKTSLNLDWRTHIQTKLNLDWRTHDIISLKVVPNYGKKVKEILKILDEVLDQDS